MRPVSRSEFSRLAGVSPAAITKACKSTLRAARAGTRINLDHPAAAAYLASKGASVPSPAAAPTAGPTTTAKGGGKAPASRQSPAKGASSKATAPTASRPKKASRKTARALEEGHGEPDIEAYLRFTLDELLRRFGTRTGFKDMLDARKKLADIAEKERKNAEARGHLISRELVKTHVFGAIEATNRRVLGDAPKTIARRLFALAKSEGAVEEAERVVREILSSQLHSAKDGASRVLRDGDRE